MSTGRRSGRRRRTGGTTRSLDGGASAAYLLDVSKPFKVTLAVLLAALAFAVLQLALAV